MAIYDTETSEVTGFQKKIHESANDLMMGILQVSQYKYPHKSTIRELVSNAIDAVKERDVARLILSGQGKVEDFFVQREGELYEDSKFKPDYYDLNWLATRDTVRTKNPDNVYITYHEGSETEKDFITIEDFGVGLGGRRLQGYFDLGYSSKRLNRHTLGKFGIGAKAALSTVDFYTMTTRYNGREYKFNIYQGKVASIIPQLNMETGKANGVHVFENGALIYYRETTERNGTTIEIAAKKHHKAIYIDAVKNQLMYFENVVLQLKTINGTTIIPTMAQILFEDDNLILSDNNQHSKPHMLINRVNYGNIDFQELELQNMNGNIGVKIEAEDVTVNPSRESVVWDEKTKEAVTKGFRNVQDAAGRLIADKLKTNDFMEWVRSCSQMTNLWADQNSVLGRLSKIVDIDKSDIFFNGDKRILWGSWLFAGFNIRSVQITEVREGSKKKFKIERHPVSPRELANFPIYYSRGKVSFKKDKYLLDKFHPGGFIIFERPFEIPLDDDGNPTMTLQQAREMTTTAMSEFLEHINTKKKVMTREELIARMDHIMNLVHTSAGERKDYESIVVPDAFDAAEEVEDEVTEEAVVAKQKRQREPGTIVAHTPRAVSSPWIPPQAKPGEVDMYQWQKLEFKGTMTDKWDNEDVFYGNDADAVTLKLAAMITRPFNNLGETKTDNSLDIHKDYKVRLNEAWACANFFQNPKVRLVKVAKDRVKLFQDFKHVNKFFSQVEGKTLTMAKALVRWNTARLMKDGITTLKFLKNFGTLSPGKAKAYKDLKDYFEAHYRDLETSAQHGKYNGLDKDTYSNLVEHLDKVTELQKFVRSNPESPDLIAHFVKEMFNPPVPITDGHSVDLPILDQYNDLMEWAEPIKVLFNNMKVFDNDGVIPDELGREILLYMEAKDVKL